MLYSKTLAKAGSALLAVWLCFGASDAAAQHSIANPLEEPRCNGIVPAPQPARLRTQRPVSLRIINIGERTPSFRRDSPHNERYSLRPGQIIDLQVTSRTPISFVDSNGQVNHISRWSIPHEPAVCLLVYATHVMPQLRLGVATGTTPPQGAANQGAPSAPAPAAAGQPAGARVTGTPAAGTQAAGTPAAAPAPAATAPVDHQEMLRLVNDFRAQPRRCGRETLAAAPPLTMNSQLVQAATAHSADMSRHNYFSHTGRNGSSPGQRAELGGYPNRFVGENIAAGHPTIQAAFDGWVKSPGHCRNMMGSQYTEFGLGHAHLQGSRYGNYWTQLFGRQ